ncbi:hypothetical protein [Hyphomicrobium sp. 99]|uniref:hypothetical protein n=1 Tax=Hyphomicrobium sp. 99 TaxID=1163419 RepID=UPI0005F7CF3C|nr:hypothetical protein [Hyphomicrobium sp. 99]
MYGTTCTIERDGEQIEVEVEYSLTPYYPAQTYGPAENCYPAEGGEIDELTAYLDGEKFELTPVEMQAVEKRIYEIDLW